MKAVPGRLVAGLICIVGVPAHLVISLLIKLFSPGPVFYRCARLGKHGVPFPLLKYRSMKVNSPQVVTAGFKTIVDEEDPRITRLGKWLRCGIDEVPQLWNIVRGEMAWIGPRPDEDWMLVNYGPVSGVRISVLPGITGLAQVLDSRNLSTAEGYAIDAWYIAHRDIWLDGWIVLATPLFMAGWRSIGRRRLRKLFQLPELQDVRQRCESELAARCDGSEACKADAAVFSTGT